MNILIGLLLAQSAPNIVTVPEPNPELDAAHACLVENTRDWLATQSAAPSKDERWRSAVAIADAYRSALRAAADSDGAAGVANHINHTNINRRQQLKLEANYYVDRLIREHFEAQS